MEAAKIFDFRRITLFCLGYCRSKHKMTISSENLVGACPPGPPGYAYGLSKLFTQAHWSHSQFSILVKKL